MSSRATNSLAAGISTIQELEAGSGDRRAQGWPAGEREVAQLIVETLHLDEKPENILPDAALFGEGLGLDSIDALELSLAISKRYGVELKSEDTRNPHIFASLRNLTGFIASARTR